MTLFIDLTFRLPNWEASLEEVSAVLPLQLQNCFDHYQIQRRSFENFGSHEKAVFEKKKIRTVFVSPLSRINARMDWSQ